MKLLLDGFRCDQSLLRKRRVERFESSAGCTSYVSLYTNIQIGSSQTRTCLRAAPLLDTPDRAKAIKSKHVPYFTRYTWRPRAKSNKTVISDPCEPRFSVSRSHQSCTHCQLPIREPPSRERKTTECAHPVATFYYSSIMQIMLSTHCVNDKVVYVVLPMIVLCRKLATLS